VEEGARDSVRGRAGLHLERVVDLLIGGVGLERVFPDGALHLREEGLDLAAVLLGVGRVEGEGEEEAVGAKLTTDGDGNAVGVSLPDPLPPRASESEWTPSPCVSPRPSPPAKPRLLLLLGFRELSTGSSTAGEGRGGGVRRGQATQ
jgi:hypothetical protein